MTFSYHFISSPSLYRISLLTLSLIAGVVTYNQNRFSPESRLIPSQASNTWGYSQLLLPPAPNELITTTLPLTFKVALPTTTITKIHLEMIISCQPECQQLWLLRGQPPANPMLIDHNLLRELAYFYISDGQLQLYERHPNYSSLSHFLNSPPRSATIYSEASLLPLLKQANLKLKLLETSQSLADADYVLTTYQFPKHHGNWFIGRDINLTQQERQSSTLYFTLSTNPNASSSSNQSIHSSQPQVLYY